MSLVLTEDTLLVRLTLERLKDRGHDVTEILKSVHLRAATVSDPEGRIPTHKEAALLEIASRLTRDRCFGLRLGMTLKPKQFGLLGYVALSSDSLRSASVKICRYHRVLSEGIEAHLESQSDGSILTWSVIDPNAKITNQSDEISAGICVSVFRALTSTNLSPGHVEFRHRGPEDIREHQRLLGCPVFFGRPRNAMTLTEARLDLPIRTADATLLRILERYCREILGKKPKKPDIVFRVRELIVGFLSEGQPGIDRVSSELGMSARTLARRLEVRGSSYRGILDDVRHQLAIQYTSDRHLRLGEVAFLLGYNDQASFNRAFRRWTGATPSEIRTT